MSSALAYLWRHPRRTGFIILNVIVLAAFIGWGTFTADMSNDGLAAVPNVMLGYTGLALLVVLWLGAWLAWAWLVARRYAQKHD
jgi:protein-S-isoprenylcysteine O-methyltransferase Ste14